MPTKKQRQAQPVFLGPAEGRLYEMGPLSAVFKADGKETGSKYSVTEWALNISVPGILKRTCP